MAANSSPMVVRVPADSSVLVTAANVSSQGGGTIGTDIFLLITAGADGSLITKVRWVVTATASVTSAACVARIFESSVPSGATNSTNTWLVDSVELPAVPAGSTTVKDLMIDRPLNLLLKAGRVLLVSNSIAPTANSAWRAFSYSGDY